MDKQNFNPKWSFRSQATLKQPLIKRLLRQYDVFLDRQFDKLPHQFRYFKLPLQPVTLVFVVAFLVGNNVAFSNYKII